MVLNQARFMLFRDLPCMASKGHFVVFNFQKGQIAEIKDDTNREDCFEYLLKASFFDTKIALTPGELRDKVEIVLNSTTACNMECQYCFLGSNQNNELRLDSQIAVEFIKKIIKISDKKNIYINFFGGEPTLNEPLIRTITEYINNLRITNRDKNFKLAITTNGSMGKNLLNYLLDNSFYFSISMDGIPFIQDAQRPFKFSQPSSKLVEENLRYIATYTDKLRVRLTVTSNSVDFMPINVKYLADLGAKIIHFECVNLAGRAVESNQKVRRPSAKDFSKYFIKSLEIAKGLDISLIHTGYGILYYPSRYMCEGISGHRIAISPSGFISHCLEVQDFNHPLSQLMKLGHANLESRDVHIPNDLRNTRFEQSKERNECVECFCKYICSNGCPSRNYHMTGDPFTIDEFYCQTTRSILKYVLKRVYQETKNQGVFIHKNNIDFREIVIPHEFKIPSSIDKVFKNFFELELNTL